MKLVQKLENSCDVTAHYDPKKLYPLVMAEMTQGTVKKSGTKYFQTLWSKVSPTGNIYRYNGFIAERMKHCEDLQFQMTQIADAYAHILGGAHIAQPERVRLLNKALGQAQVCGGWAMHNEKTENPPVPGFPPLQEYIDDEVSRFGPVLEMADDQQRDHHRKAVTMTLFIFCIQILAPGIVCLNRWAMKSNYLRDPHNLFARLTLAEAFCLGVTTVEKCSTVMGVCFITVIIFYVRLYVAEQNENAVKSSRLPTDPFWLTVGIITNMWCCLLTVLTVPLLLWSEDTPTNIVLDSMTLLFVFKMDDFSELMAGLIRMTDEEFQRMTSWNVALLAQCPTRVQDLCNHEATNVQDLWCIKFDAAGHLLNAPQPGREPSSVCETRLSHVVASETSHLILAEQSARGSGVVVPSGRIRYHRSQQHSVELPSLFSNALHAGWAILGVFLFALQFLIPVVWFVVNKPCY